MGAVPGETAIPKMSMSVLDMQRKGWYSSSSVVVIA